MHRNDGRKSSAFYDARMLDSDPKMKLSGVDALPVFGPSFKVYDSHWLEIREQALALGVLNDGADETPPPPVFQRPMPPAPVHAPTATKSAPVEIVLPMPDTRQPIAAIEVEIGG